MGGTWVAHGWFMGGTWVAHGWHMGGTWVAHGWHMGGTWVAHGWYMGVVHGGGTWVHLAACALLRVQAWQVLGFAGGLSYTTKRIERRGGSESPTLAARA